MSLKFLVFGTNGCATSDLGDSVVYAKIQLRTHLFSSHSFSFTTWSYVCLVFLVFCLLYKNRLGLKMKRSIVCAGLPETLQNLSSVIEIMLCGTKFEMGSNLRCRCAENAEAHTGVVSPLQGSVIPFGLQFYSYGKNLLLFPSILFCKDFSVTK